MEVKVLVKEREQKDLAKFVECCKNHGLKVTREGGGKLLNFSGYFAELKGDGWKDELKSKSVKKKQLKYILSSAKLNNPLLVKSIETSWHLDKDGKAISDEAYNNCKDENSNVVILGVENFDELNRDINEDFCEKNNIFWIECCGLQISPALTTKEKTDEEWEDDDYNEERVFRICEARKIGLFKYFENYYGLTKIQNQAGLIYEIAKNSDMTCIEFINLFCNKN